MWRDFVRNLPSDTEYVAVLKRVAEHLQLQVGLLVELGTWKGDGAWKLKDLFPCSLVVTVDNWLYRQHSDRMYRRRTDQADWEQLYQDACRRFLLVRYSLQGRVLPLRMDTHEAAKALPDKLDLVFIDASHDYEDVQRDIADWLPKVRPGGILAGHDFRKSGRHKGVSKAVKEAFGDAFAVHDPSRVWVHVRA